MTFWLRLKRSLVQSCIRLPRVAPLPRTGDWIQIAHDVFRVDGRSFRGEEATLRLREMNSGAFARLEAPSDETLPCVLCRAGKRTTIPRGLLVVYPLV